MFMNSPRLLIAARTLLVLVLFSLGLFSASYCVAEDSLQEHAATIDHPSATHEDEDHTYGDGHDHASLGKDLPLWSVLPFASLLLCVAILPLITPHWWEHNSSKGIVVAVLSIPMAAYLLTVWGNHGAGHQLLEKIHEYISFIALLGALYVISGGVYIRGSLSGTPLSNTALLGIGTLLASFIGTTGASVLLIRPLLRANESRKARAHLVIFFIFTVSNCGGLLTPLGDPPLFLGFLKGVPFEWTGWNLWPQWLMVNLILLAIFNLWDQNVLDREEKAREGSQLEELMKHEPLGIDGGLNFLFLAGVVGAIVMSKYLPLGVPEILMILLALGAYFTTSQRNRELNKFTFGPINEVAVLFIGIFITMIPALLILNAWGEGSREIFGFEFGLSKDWHYFWATGILSSFLDNAPTYLAMAAPACGQFEVEVSDKPYLGEFLAKGPEAAALLKAISCGAVFMGANTYIGNGPNFMVKAIAEEGGVRMPSFFGYMAYSLAILTPIFIAVTLVFFRGGV